MQVEIVPKTQKGIKRGIRRKQLKIPLLISDNFSKRKKKVTEENEDPENFKGS